MSKQPTAEDRKRAREFLMHPQHTFAFSDKDERALAMLIDEVRRASAGVGGYWHVQFKHLQSDRDKLLIQLAKTRHAVAHDISKEILSTPIYESDVRAACAAIARRHGGCGK